MRILSPVLRNQGGFPKRFTCQGENVSPELSWEGAPKESKFFVLILHDHDAPRRNGFTHWVLYDIPAGIDRVRENVPRHEKLAGAGLQGRNDSGEIGYTGPCPPNGRHRYFLRLYALREKLGLPAGATADEVRIALDGNVIEQCELMATYEKSGSPASHEPAKEPRATR
jgi:Raf kinase inhibitor-like YbhB/YbcL family protein